MQDDFKCPGSASMQRKAEMKIQVVEAGVEFLVRGPSVTNIWYGHGWRPHSDTVIQHVRQSNIALNVTTTGNVDPNELRIQVVQKSKAFPLGTVVNSWTYVDERKWRYRDFIHTHFNWAVLESSLKWGHVEPSQGHYNFNLPLRVVDSLRNKGLKIRGHNLIWPLESLVPSWVKELSGEDLRAAVQDHISHTMNRTRGRLEHWDVMNENLHGQWFQERLRDFSFEQTPFRLAHSLDSHVKLFLNDYDIVAHGKLTGAYVAQAQRLQKAGVGLQGLGVQCHFWNEEEPDPYLIKDRLDKLAQTGLPIWVTEFNVVAANETRRADFVEKAMRAFYGHPAVEGILIWGFWDQSHSRGPHAALTKGDTMQLTSAGERFLDLWERQWMTDETHVLSESGSRFNVRGFHGDYEMHVWYQGKELVEFRQNFTLGKTDRSIDVTVRL
ncbi:anti-sigma-I factor RsgI6-like isoform X3 [Babylonia areolata]|uniref:anti-sigma-I factor RsgI6-like isoform X3 n=1 Tax=Babylonia areolata TaxID=304850 RepID=UPI003FD23E0A